MSAGASKPRADTKERILDTAERLFARAGVDAVSLRQIMREAGANAAAIHYHFGSKDNLLLEIMARRLQPVSRRRLALLDGCRETPGRPPVLEQIIEAFLRPVIEWIEDGGGFYDRRIHAKLSFERGYVQKRLYADHALLDARFVEALRRALPDLPAETLYWRFSFIVGNLIYVIAGVGRVEDLSGGRYDPGDPDRAVAEMVALLAAGLRAPTSGAGAAKAAP